MHDHTEVAVFRIIRLLKLNAQDVTSTCDISPTLDVLRE